MASHEKIDLWDLSQSKILPVQIDGSTAIKARAEVPETGRAVCSSQFREAGVGLPTALCSEYCRHVATICIVTDMCLKEVMALGAQL
jgi:hypothetical protein